MLPTTIGVGLSPACRRQTAMGHLVCRTGEAGVNRILVWLIVVVAALPVKVSS